MNESQLRTIAQLEDFLKGSTAVEFSASQGAGANDTQRYKHVSRVLKRFDYAPPMSDYLSPLPKLWTSHIEATPHEKNPTHPRV